MGEFENKPGQEEQKTEDFAVLLPSDEARIKQLKLKLEEYKMRAVRHRVEAERQGGNIAYVAPEVLLDQDTNYKILVLERMLKTGGADFKDLALEIPKNDLPRLRNALSVIKSYAETGGEGLRGGTGLPDVEQ